MSYVGVLRCFRWNTMLACGNSSVRSAVSIAQAVLDYYKLRQERHGEEHHKSPCRHTLNSNHAAPDGAWMAFWGSCSINTALLTELSQSPIPPKTAKNLHRLHKLRGFNKLRGFTGFWAICDGVRQGERLLEMACLWWKPASTETRALSSVI